MAGFFKRVKKSWSVFNSADDVTANTEDSGHVVVVNPNNFIPTLYINPNQRVLAPIITRIAIDASMVELRHVQQNKAKRFESDVPGSLNDRLNRMANVDQTARVYIQDLVTIMLEEGVCAIVPTETSDNPGTTSSYDIYSWRVGKIIDWGTDTVLLDVYNESSGEVEPVRLSKSYVAIIYNPLYGIMNEFNSTLNRLMEKLALADSNDLRSVSPSLDIILQLPYTTALSKKQLEAEQRVKSLESQLYGSAYGIGYIDPTEKIHQLNRPVANVLGDVVSGLTSDLYNQLGLTEAVFNGTASNEEMLTYYNRTVFPILLAVVDGMNNTMFTTTSITQGHAIQMFPDLFKMAGIDTIADAADKLSRNAIMTVNEFRQILGLEPTKQPIGDELRNKNMPDVDPQKGGDANKGEKDTEAT